jgi:hypothetical protein
MNKYPENGTKENKARFLRLGESQWADDTVRADIDYMTDGEKKIGETYENKFGIKAAPSTASAHSVTFFGTRKSMQKMLIHHYADPEDAIDLHPDVFSNHTRK